MNLRLRLKSIDLEAERSMKYFTADLHIDHEKAMSFPGRRGITLSEWQEMLLSNINERVKRSDTLYIIGDFAFKPKVWRPKIKCGQVYLIKGNHDPSNIQCEAAFGKDRVKDSMCIKVCGTQTYLLHYPCLVWPASHYGAYSLFGHVHDGRTDFWNGIPYLRGRRALDVCPESYKRHFGTFGVFSEDEIDAILKVKPGHDDVSWYRENHGSLE